MEIQTLIIEILLTITYLKNLIRKQSQGEFKGVFKKLNILGNTNLFLLFCLNERW